MGCWWFAAPNFTWCASASDTGVPTLVIVLTVSGFDPFAPIVPSGASPFAINSSFKLSNECAKRQALPKRQQPRR
uniref:Putative secreted protein n=1 Tax=Anopheles triannulatus TaxID=58253 RepID=A0A2M4B438_9DIPT